MWEGQELLCALSLGKVSKGRVNATIHLLQANPARPPGFKGHIGEMVVDYLRIYAQAAECKRMVIDSPFSELVEFYKELGFQHEVRKHGKVRSLWQLVGS